MAVSLSYKVILGPVSGYRPGSNLFGEPHHLAVFQIGELMAHQPIHGGEHLPAFLQSGSVDVDAVICSGSPENVKFHSKACGLLDERVQGFLARSQPLEAGVVVSCTHITTYYDKSPALRWCVQLTTFLPYIVLQFPSGKPPYAGQSSIFSLENTLVRQKR